METFLKKKNAVATGTETLRTFSTGKTPRETPTQHLAKPSSQGDRGKEYLQKCRALKIRGKILKNEMEDTKRELQGLEKQIAAGKYVMDTLLREEEEALAKVKSAQAALDLVRQHKEKHMEKTDRLQQAKVESTRKVQLIQTTIQTIEKDADKAQVLLQNYMPGTIVEV